MQDLFDKNVFLLKYAQLMLSSKARYGLYEKMAAYLDDGVPLDSILKRLGGEYMRRGFDVRGYMLQSIYRDIEGGKSLSDSLKAWAPATEIMLIKAGEESGDISNAFKNASYATKSSSGMVSAVLGSLAYPFVLLIMLAIIIVVFSLYAIPTLTMIKDPSEWPEVSKGLYTLSQFVENKWWVVVALIFGFIAFFNWSSKNLTGPVRFYLDKVPPWSMYKSFQGSVFMISVSAMMKSGKPIYDSIRDLELLSNKYISSHLTTMMNKLHDGSSVGDSFSQGFLDRETEIDIRVSGETSNIEESISKIGKMSIDNAIKRINSISMVINMLCMSSIAGFIFWAYYSFFVLSYSMK